MLTGGVHKPFETTFRCVTYTVGSTQILMILPFIGGMLAMGWNLIALSVALREAHRISMPRAIIAVLLPMLVCIGGLLTIILAATVAVAGKIK